MLVEFWEVDEELEALPLEPVETDQAMAEGWEMLSNEYEG